MHFNTLHISVQVDFSQEAIRNLFDFNTLHVSVQGLARLDAGMVVNPFQYITCIGSRLLMYVKILVNSISIHYMYRFKSSPLSISKAATIISIHYMYRFKLSKTIGTAKSYCISIHYMYRFKSTIAIKLPLKYLISIHYMYRFKISRTVDGFNVL